MPGTDSLRAEEAAVFAHVLGEALDSPEVRAAMRRTPDAADRERLRLRAHRERDTLCAAAASEYEAYARLRTDDDTHPGTGSDADADARTATGSGGGLLPALAVLVPSLGAVAAVLFLAIGFGMRLVGIHRQFADELVYAGWIAAGVAAAATAAGLVWLLVTAARNRSATPAHGDAAPGGDCAGQESEAARARAAWQVALLERGILPFLLRRIDEERARAGTAAAPAPRSRPGYSAPEYGSPEYGSPEYASPGYAGPAYGSPAYESPDRQG
ncbi:hypothetical protein [Streptomyces sp. NPDC059788]|uniref:hypothetical protein n=1 Tax=Streptomyces sp. NPDC059788 TaxID=3346948 RepID=UPI0036513265